MSRQINHHKRLLKLDVVAIDFGISVTTGIFVVIRSYSKINTVVDLRGLPLIHFVFPNIIFPTAESTISFSFLFGSVMQSNDVIVFHLSYMFHNTIECINQEPLWFAFIMLSSSSYYIGWSS